MEAKEKYNFLLKGEQNKRSLYVEIHYGKWG